MLNKIKQLWTKLWEIPSPDALSDLLSNQRNREDILGVRHPLQDSKQKIEADARKVVQYSASDDYAVWVEEAWAQMVSCIKKLSDEKLSDSETHFYRGSMSSIADMLRIAQFARSSLLREEPKKTELKQI